MARCPARNIARILGPCLVPATAEEQHNKLQSEVLDMVGWVARTSLWHVVGVVIIFACLLPLLSLLCSPNNSISGALQSSSIIHHVQGRGSSPGAGTNMNRTWDQTELRHHRDYVTAAADLRFIIVKLKRKLARQMDRYARTPAPPYPSKNPLVVSMARWFALHLASFLFACLDANWTTATGYIDLWTWEIDFWYIIETLKWVHCEKTRGTS